MALLRLAALARVAAGAAALLAPAPGWDDFPVFVWRQEHGGESLPEALFEPFLGTNVERAEPADWVRERGGTFYVGHAPGRDELHLRREGRTAELAKRWYETRDPSLLVRVPCLTVPETRAALFEQLERSLAARGGDHGLGISLGDEISLTPWGDPSDVCRSETCTAAWERWCAERGLDPDDAPTTDETRTSFARGDASRLGAWLARRRFHQDVVVGLLEELAARARELAPGTPVGALGMAGRTTFGGVAIERVLGFLDFVEPYRVDDARELTATLLEPRHRRLVTVFPESGGAPAAAWQVWEHFLRGGDGAVLWSDRELARSPETRDRLAGAVADVRRARAEIGRWRPEPGGVAVVHSPDSIALAWLRDALLDGPTWPNRLARYQRENGTRDRALRAWLLLFEDVGLLPGAIPLGDVGADTVRRFPLLVLSHVGVVGDAEAAGLERFVAAGGRLVIEGDFARFDPAGRPRATDLRARLAEAAGDAAPPGGALLEPPPRVGEYPRLRVRPPGSSGTAIPTRAEVLRETARGWLAGSDRLPPFAPTADEPALPWLCAFRATADGWLCVALPNAADEAERTALRAAACRLRIPEGHRVEWIHPRPIDGADGDAGPPELAPGDAAVFRIARE